MTARGLSLVELLVAIAVLATLSAISIPVGRSFIAKSRQTACLGQLRGLGVALEGYLQDHLQRMPKLAQGRPDKADASEVLETVLLPYVDGPQAFACPQDAVEHAKTGSSYFWNPTQNGRHVTKLEFFNITDQPEKIPLIFDKQAWHPGGTNFLYADRSSSTEIRFAAGN